MKRTLTYIVLFNLILSSLVFGKIPKWVKKNSHPDYPAEKYFIGIGINEDRSQAEDLARANLIKEISVKIESELENIETERIKNGKVKSLSQMKQKISSIVSADLVGVQIAKMEKEKKTYYALAVLSKLKYYTTLEIKIDELGQRIQSLIDDSNKLQEEGYLLTAVKNYKECYDLLDDYVEKSSLYTALTGRSFAVLDELDSTKIDMNIQRIVTNTTLSVLEGAGQTGISGTKLPETIVVKAIYKTPTSKEVPVQNLPVMVSYENGEKIDKLITGPAGKIRTNITTVPTDETGKEGRVKFASRFDNVRTNLPLPEVSLTYQVKTTQVSFEVRVDNPALQRKISGMIAENGYTVTDNGDFLVTATATLSDEKEVETPFGNMYMAKVDATLNLVNKKTDSSVAAMKAAGVATEKTVEKAHQSAVSKIKINKKDLIAFLAKAID